jgi:hypothetical protein
MKRAFSILMVAASLVFAPENVDANPSMTPAAKPKSGPAPAAARPYPVPPIIVRPRVVPPVVRVVPPPIVRVVPPVVAAPVAPATGFGGAPLTSNAWVGQDPITRRFSIAFDSPGVSGTSILIRAGYNNIVRGPTTWTDATSFLKSIGAPGW